MRVAHARTLLRGLLLQLTPFLRRVPELDWAQLHELGGKLLCKGVSRCAVWRVGALPTARKLVDCLFVVAAAPHALASGGLFADLRSPFSRRGGAGPG